MRSKGLIEAAVIVVIAFVMMGTIATLGTQQIVNTGDLIRSETIGIMGERIESTVYAVSSFEEAKVEMEFQDSEYKVYSNDTGKYLEYSYSGEANIHPLEEPYDVSYTVEESEEDELIEEICISKSEDDIEITAGAC